MARKPKDNSAYFEEARELRRLFPKRLPHAIGKMMEKRHPDVRGLAQAVRKQLSKEKNEAARLTNPAPAPPPPPSTASVKRRTRNEPRDEAGQRKILEQAKTTYKVLEDAALMKKIIEKDQKTWEALRSDPTFNELLRRLFEDG